MYMLVNLICLIKKNRIIYNNKKRLSVWCMYVYVIIIIIIIIIIVVCCYCCCCVCIYGICNCFVFGMYVCPCWVDGRGVYVFAFSYGDV